MPITPLLPKAFRDALRAVFPHRDDYADGQMPVREAGAWATVDRADLEPPGATLLATQITASATTADNSTTSTTLVAMATDDRHDVTFTVPGSGRVIVRVIAGDYGSEPAWGLLEGTTEVADSRLGTPTGVEHRTATFAVTGLTPGDVKTYRPAHRSIGGSSTTVRYGSIQGPLIVEVWAA